MSTVIGLVMLVIGVVLVSLWIYVVALLIVAAGRFIGRFIYDAWCELEP